MLVYFTITQPDYQVGVTSILSKHHTNTKYRSGIIYSASHKYQQKSGQSELSRNLWPCSPSESWTYTTDWESKSRGLGRVLDVHIRTNQTPPRRSSFLPQHKNQFQNPLSHIQRIGKQIFRQRYYNPRAHCHDLAIIRHKITSQKLVDAPPS